MLYLRTLVPCTRALANQARRKLSTGTTLWKRTAPQHLTMQLRTLSTDSSAGGDTQQVQQRVYLGPLASRIKAVKAFSLTSSIVGLVAQPMLLEQGMKLGGTAVTVFICGVVGIFTFITPLLLHFITKKYVTEVHYNPKTEEYTATTISFLLREIHTKFRPSDVKVPEVPGMFTSFLLGKRPLFVDPAFFEDPEHYVRIMGYDKPMDFKLSLPEEPPEAKQQK